MVQDGKLPDKYTVNLLVELLDSHGQHEKVGKLSQMLPVYFILLVYFEYWE